MNLQSINVWKLSKWLPWCYRRAIKSGPYFSGFIGVRGIKGNKMWVITEVISLTLKARSADKTVHSFQFWLGGCFNPKSILAEFTHMCQCPWLSLETIRMIHFSFGHELNYKDHDSLHGTESRGYHQFIPRWRSKYDLFWKQFQD